LNKLPFPLIDDASIHNRLDSLPIKILTEIEKNIPISSMIWGIRKHNPLSRLATEPYHPIYYVCDVFLHRRRRRGYQVINYACHIIVHAPYYHTHTHHIIVNIL